MSTPRAEILQGDCRSLMANIADNWFDAIVTDPPYELGFMGRRWDRTGVAYDLATWKQALRVLKPGGWLVAFGGSRTYHRMACAIEDAGFDIRDQIMWIYGSGFPKGGLRDGMGTCLKPAHEPIVLARKALVGTVGTNQQLYGTGALNIDACRIGVGDDRATGGASGKRLSEGYGGRWASAEEGQARPAGGRWPANVVHDGSEEVLSTFPDAPGQRSDLRNHATSRQSPNGIFGGMRPALDHPARGDRGSAARFFYCAKASKADRGDGNIHETVKPERLMRWLVRMVTPPGGLVLDPFSGSGSTGRAALLEGFDFVGMELMPEYAAIANARIDKLFQKGAA
ncbi:DNA-methyltransferase [uncultured Sphingomonas sp.]|uniref:DNA-methyltransferase n=1 Tax=uncultured Sphingomonas sp. TaxID=158754 RepID=UPI00374A0C66